MVTRSEATFTGSHTIISPSTFCSFGERNCDCTSFQPRKSSAKCKTCSHLQRDHQESSGNDSSADSNSDSDSDDNVASGCDKTVSALLTNLLEDGNYTGVEVESARNEAKAGLTKKRVSRFLDYG